MLPNSISQRTPAFEFFSKCKNVITQEEAIRCLNDEWDEYVPSVKEDVIRILEKFQVRDEKTRLFEAVYLLSDATRINIIVSFLRADGKDFFHKPMPGAEKGSMNKLIPKPNHKRVQNNL